jgi:hypothetical protein
MVSLRLAESEAEEVTQVSEEQPNLDRPLAIAGGAGDDLESDPEEWAAVAPG